MIDPKLDSKEIHLRMLLPIHPPFPALKNFANRGPGGSLQSTGMFCLHNSVLKFFEQALKNTLTLKKKRPDLASL